MREKTVDGTFNPSADVVPLERWPARDYSDRCTRTPVTTEIHHTEARAGMRTTRSRASRAADWLVGPMLLCATVGAVSLVFRGPIGLFAIALACFGVLGVAWLLVCVFSSARADRTCPSCGRADLERLDPLSTRGVVCRTCGRFDREQSSFLMAEEEGPIEPIVMRERQRK
jgi:hypothetical protein